MVVIANGVLDLGIDLDVWPWIWLVVAVVFALVELIFVGGTFVLLPFAASAFIAALLAFYDVPIEVQWIVFVFGGGLLFAVLYHWIRNVVQHDELPAGAGAERLLGLTGIVAVEVRPHDIDRRGRVAIEGEVWGALTNGESLPAGTRVRVSEVVGTRVIVESLAPAPPSHGSSEPERSTE